MTEAQIKSLTEGEPLTVRPVMGTVATQEERHDYPELGLRRFDGCDLLPLNVHARAKEDVKEAVWEASANLSGCGAHSFVGAINRPHVEQMLEQAWNKLVFGTSPQEKLTAQRRVNYLNRLIGMIDAHKGNRYTDIRVVENRRRREGLLKELTAGKPTSLRLLQSSEPARQESRGWRRAGRAFLRLFGRGAGK